MLSTLTARYGGERTADALLKVMEEAVGLAEAEGEAGDPPKKRQKPDPDQKAADVSNGFTLKAHRAVLWPLSEYFASKFTNWSNSSGMPEVTILVPAGHLDVGKALIAAMYDKLPDDISQQQLLQLLVLSDSYKIDSVTEAVISRFSSFSLEQLQWDVVLDIEQLPGGQFASLKSAAQRRITQLLGDLEVVWGLEHPHQRQVLQKQFSPCSAAAMKRRAEAALKAGYGSLLHLHPRHHAFAPPTPSELRDAAVAAQTSAVAAAANPTPPHELMLQLPFEQLVGLLQSKELRVISENSIHYTIKRWLGKHPDNTSEQLKQLAGLVRLHQCTVNYLINVVCQEGDWLMQHYSGPQLAKIVAACIAERHSTLGQVLTLPDPMEFPECYGLQRSASALADLQLSCRIPLGKLQEIYHDALGSDSTTYCHPEKFFWQGTELSFQLALELSLGDQDDDVGDDGIPVGAGYVHAMHVGFGVSGGAGFSSLVTVYKTPLQAGQQSVEYIRQNFEYKTSVPEQRAYIMIDDFWHLRVHPLPAAVINDHVEMQYTAGTWDELQQKLRDLRLVHEDGCLHLTAVLRQLC